MSSAKNQWSVRYRPDTLDKIVGQDAAVAFARGLLKRDSAPGCILITGPSGTGKTTLGRLIAAHLSGWRGNPDDNPDLVELAANVERTIDDVRTAIQQSKYSPRGGRRRVMLVDEVQGFVGPAASALLKAVEDPPSKATWILCTDQVHKIQRQMLNRCMIVALKQVSDDAVIDYLKRVCVAEKIRFGTKHDAVLSRIAKASYGVPRSAVQMLESVYTIVKGGGRVDRAIMSVTSDSGQETFEATLQFFNNLIANKTTEAVSAVCSTKPDGMVELLNQMIVEAIRIASGSNPGGGLGWVVKKRLSIKSSDLPTLLIIQSKMVAALDMRSRYVVPSESLLFALLRK